MKIDKLFRHTSIKTFNRNQEDILTAALELKNMKYRIFASCINIHVEKGEGLTNIFMKIEKIRD